MVEKNHVTVEMRNKMLQKSLKYKDETYSHKLGIYDIKLTSDNKNLVVRAMPPRHAVNIF